MIVSRRTAVCLTLFASIQFILVGCGGGGGKSPQPKPPTPMEKFTYAGKVVDEDARAIAGAIIQLSQLYTETDEDGNFRFENLSGGNYNISAQAPDGTFLATMVNLGGNILDARLVLDRNPENFALTRVNPPLRGTEVPQNAEIELLFSRELMPENVKDYISLSPYSGELDLAIEGAVLTIRPKFELDETQQYRLAISRNLRDIEGNSLGVDVYTYFTVSDDDNVPAILIGSSPENDETNVFRNVEVELTFSDKLNPNQTRSDLALAINPNIPFEVSIKERKLKIKFIELLQANTRYTVSILGLKDDAGNISSPVELTFVTGQVAQVTDDIEPDWTRFGNVIVFSRKIGGTYELFSLKLDGKELTRLTETDFNERHPRLSSDGVYVSYQSDENGNWDIYSMRLATREVIQLTTSLNDEIQPDFSSTFSQTIAYTKRQGFNLPAKIFTMNRDGSFQREADISFFRSESEPNFHPLQDNQLLFITDDGGDADVFIKSGFLGESRAVNFNLTSALSSNETFAVWSADGESVAVLSDFGGRKNIWLFDLSGTIYRQVTNFSTDIHSFAFSPNPGEDLLIVSMGESGQRHLALVSVSTGEIIEDIT